MGFIADVVREKRTRESRARGVPARRNYSAAKYTNLTASWTAVPLTADEVVFRSLRTLRARSREMVANNDYAKRFIGMVKSHVVGPEGFNFQARVKNRAGGLDSTVNEAIEMAWRVWGKPANSDYLGRTSFAELIRLWIGTIATDGEVLVRIHRGPEFGPYQFALQFIDPELLDVTHNDELGGGRRIIMGIEYDASDRPVAYWLRTGQPVPPQSGSSYSGKRVRIGAREIFHHYLVERVGQRRGIPWLATSALRMKMLGGYEEAALVNARAGAAKHGFYKTKDDADPNDAGYAMANDEGELIDDAEAGHWQLLPPGIDPVFNNPAYPESEFEPFCRHHLQGLASGLGVASFKLSGNLADINYSSAKIGELEERELWRALQNWCIESFLMPLYESWISDQVIGHSIQVGGRPLAFARMGDYLAVEFQGRRWKFNEPLKEISAQEKELKLRLTSPQRVIREAGRDPQDVINEWSAWNEMLDAAGVDMQFADNAPQPAQNQNEDMGNA